MTKTDSLIDLARRIKAYQAHVAGKPNQDRFIELCDELFEVLRTTKPVSVQRVCGLMDGYDNLSEAGFVVQHIVEMVLDAAGIKYAN